MEIVDYICKNVLENNKYEGFIIKEGMICGRLNNTKRMYNNIELLPAVLESKEYDQLTCSSLCVIYSYRF